MGPHRTLALTFATLTLALAVPGCEEDPPADPPSRFVTPEELAGTWLRTASWGSERVEFGTNLTIVWTVTDELGTDTWDGVFEIAADGRLVTTIAGTSFEGGVSESWTNVEQSTLAVVGDRLFFGALLRTEGEGETLEGPWHAVDGEREEVTVDDGGDVTTEVEEHLTTIEVTIDGDRVDTRFEETQVVEGQTYFGRERLVGTLRLDGDRAWVTYTEQDSAPIPEEEQEEELLGWILDGDTLDIATSEDGDPAEDAFLRQ
jgi:hypothetical protein